MNFYLCGRLRRTAYLSISLNEAELQQRIKDGCHNMIEQEPDRLHKSVIRRLQLCTGM